MVGSVTVRFCGGEGRGFVTFGEVTNECGYEQGTYPGLTEL